MKRRVVIMWKRRNKRIEYRPPDLAGNVYLSLAAMLIFAPPFLDGWVATKRLRDVRSVAARPHPHEFLLYLDT